jgi:3-phenylpropionate/cinnamic acid dioxygenase small subunit
VDTPRSAGLLAKRPAAGEDKEVGVTEIDELGARLQRLEDLEEIRRLFESYGYYLDHGLWAQYASLFAENGQMRLGPVRADGREAIEAAAREQLGAQFDPRPDHVRLVHIISNPRIELDGDRATAEVMWTVVSHAADGTVVVSGQGHHLDDLVREDGHWRIQKRRGFQDFP